MPSKLRKTAPVADGPPAPPAPSAPPTSSAAERLASWRIEWDGREYTDDDLTGAHATDIGFFVGFDWADLTPWKSILHLQAFIAVLEAHATGAEVQEVVDKVKAAPLSLIVASLNTR